MLLECRDARLDQEGQQRDAVALLLARRVEFLAVGVGLRKVTVVGGVGKFVSLNQLEVIDKSGTRTVSFERAIIAAGLRAGN